MDKKTLDKFAEELKGFFATMEGKYDMVFDLKGMRYSPSKATVSFEMRETESSGERIYTELEHNMANMSASKFGLMYTGNILGSTWEVRGNACRVVEHSTRRPKYPLVVQKEDGSLAKCGFGYLAGGVQTATMPTGRKDTYTYEEFVKWVELDPESDAIHPKDEDLVDEINAYITMDIEKDMDIVDRFYEVFEEFEKEEDMDTLLPQIYTTLFIDRDMRGAIISMNNFKKK